jgi:hypothetical protein
MRGNQQMVEGTICAHEIFSSQCLWLIGSGSGSASFSQLIVLLPMSEVATIVLLEAFVGSLGTGAAAGEPDQSWC